MYSPAHQPGISADTPSLTGVSERDSEDIGRLLTEYKASVLKSVIKANGREHFELRDDVKDSEGNLLLAKGAPKNDNELRMYLGKLLTLKLQHPIEYYIGVINPREVEKLHVKMLEIATSLSDKGVIEKFGDMKEVIEEVVAYLSHDAILLNRLTVLENEYVSGFGESLLTAILSTAIGEKLGYNFSKRVNTFTAGLLHHIGEIPLFSLFNRDRLKKENLSYDDITRIRNHPIAGYLILSGSDDIPTEIRDAVLKHHLFLDGSGYPRAFKLTETDDLAKLICLTSSFVTMQSRGRRKMEQVVRLLDIYSRTSTRDGEQLSPLYEREYFTTLLTLNPRQIVLMAPEKSTDGGKGYALEDILRLHNTYVFFKDRNEELQKLGEVVELYVSRNHIPEEVQTDLDALCSYLARLKSLTSDAKKFMGVTELKLKPELVPELMMDAELIRMELRSYVGRMEETILALTPLFEKNGDPWVVSKARHFTTRVRNSMPDSILEKSSF